MNLHLEVITPEKVIYKNEVEQVVVNTQDGQITILPNHIGLLTKLMAAGELIVKKGNQQQMLAVTGGFLEVSNNQVSVLADYAIRAEDIEVAKVQEAQKRAENLMKEKVSEHDFRVASAELQKAVLQLHVAKKHKKRSPTPSSSSQ